MEKEDETKLAAIREKIHATADEITAFSRNILKTEWKTVKKGETAYQLTKKWSIAGSVLMLFILISISAHAAFSIWKESIKKDATIDRVKISAASTIPAPPSIAVPSSIRTIDDSLPAGIHISSMATCEHVSSPTQTRKTNTGSTHANSGAKTCPNS
jgi:hypothetical protein